MEVYIGYKSMEEKQAILNSQTMVYVREEMISNRHFLVYDDGSTVLWEIADPVVEAFVAVVLDEFNIIRAELTDLESRLVGFEASGTTAKSFPARTFAQLKNAIKGKLGI